MTPLDAGGDDMLPGGDGWSDVAFPGVEWPEPVPVQAGAEAPEGVEPVPGDALPLGDLEGGWGVEPVPETGVAAAARGAGPGGVRAGGVAGAAVGGDAFTPFEAVLRLASLSDPWGHERGEAARYEPDAGLLERLLSVPVGRRERSESGRFARGIDIWLAHELRRAGFGEDEVWPRATRPRVLPRDVAVLLESLPRALADEVRKRIPSSVGPVDARVLGRAYEKQVDVVVSRWDRGPELLVSTKAQLSSFGKNLPNRFEEAYGDAANLRARYPLAAVGFFFVQRATVRTEEPDAYERTVDMMRKLRDIGAGSGYTTTGLLLVDWDEPAGPETEVRVVPDVPGDVAAPQFFTSLVDTVLGVTPVQHHVEVRRRRHRRDIPVAEESLW